MHTRQEQGKERQNEYKPIASTFDVKVSYRFVLLSLLSCVLVAFIIGRTARMVLLVNPQKDLLAMTSASHGTNGEGHRMKLPHPVMRDGAETPRTSYTSKNFDTARSASINSRFVITEEGEKCDSSATQCRRSDLEPNEAAPEDEEEHDPTGQHLLMDIANVDSSFLASEERLSVSMLELVKQCGLTLLSYHCHGLVPSGVSCVGILLESHVSFHTWPAKGVITLDLYTCGSDVLLPFVSITKDLFAIPSPTGTEQPSFVWSHKFRGFSNDLQAEIAERSDFFRFPIGQMMDYKEQIISAETNFQQVDIYDVLRPHFQSVEAYEKSQLNDGSYESQHPELFEPDRIVFLDGILQSRRSGDAAYHESLVHPGMFAHPNPKRVAIVGGGEGATLREVLKHKTVETVVMVEIDKQMVDLSKKYLPFWSDCSSLVGSTLNCFDDPRVDAYYEDAFRWFIDRFSGDALVEEERFDVIIMDALDPQVQVDIVEALYDGGPFLTSLPNSLRDDGILIAQVGEAAKMEAPAEERSWHRNRVKFIKTLIATSFESVREYEESHAGFYYPWQFVVAFKDFQSRAGWFLDEAMTNVEIHQRILATKNGESALQYFDGATMLSYRFPSKASERVFCLRDSKSDMCGEKQGESHKDRQLEISKLEARHDGDRSFVSTTVAISFTDSADTRISSEEVIDQYFSGNNTYNPFAERNPRLYPSAIPTRKLR